MQLPPIFLNLEAEEKEYFLSLAESREKELALHENPGRLWEKDEKGKNWSNVTEHCLIEAARVRALADLLGLESNVREELVSAAAVHDFYKKEEIRLTREDIAAGGSGRNGVFIAEGAGEKILRAAGFSDTVISLSGHLTADPKDVYYIKEILDLPNLSSENIAQLVMHYIDNYTCGSAWAEPAEHRGTIGTNDIDRRNNTNALNPTYEKMNREGLALNNGHPFFNGMTRFEAATALNHLIEKRFADIIRKRGGEISDPLDLPELVDTRVKENIQRNSGLS